MTWRIDRDESRFTDAQLIAWDFVLPHKHVCIIDSDKVRAEALTKYLSDNFSRQCLSSVVRRKQLRNGGLRAERKCSGSRGSVALSEGPPDGSVVGS